MFFYYTTITSAGTSVASTSDSPKRIRRSTRCSTHRTSNIRVFRADCDIYSNFTIPSMTVGQVNLTINGATAGQQFVV